MADRQVTCTTPHGNGPHKRFTHQTTAVPWYFTHAQVTAASDSGIHIHFVEDSLTGKLADL